MNSWSSPLGGSAKTATRFETPLCTRSAASSAPAPSESIDKTMMSAGATGSSTTSAHPAARKTGSRRERIATIANAANASAARIVAHLGHPKFSSLHRYYITSTASSGIAFAVYYHTFPVRSLRRTRSIVRREHLGIVDNRRNL